jgi:uncharacterized protein (DUF697 family)
MPMPSPWRIASVWRVIRDVDLDGIRDAALERFELWIVADDLADSVALADLLSGPGERHPWISVFASHDVAAAHSATSGAGALAPAVSAVLLVSRNAALSESLARARQQATETHAPVLTVILGHTGPAASARGENEHARVAVAALDANGLAAMASTLLALFPDDRRLALGRQLPSLRPALFDGLIQDTAQANATFAFTTGLAETMPLLTAPMNVGDIVVLTKNQLMLGYRIVLASGRSGEPRKLIGEIVGVLGGGLLFRQIARQLIGLIPVAGLVPKVAIAYTGTWAIGRAIAAWANEGRTITGDLVRTYSAEAVARGRSFAERLVGEAREGSRRLIRRG